MPYKSMNLKEAAAYLHLEAGDVRSFAMHGEIPFERPGDSLVFRRGQLKDWASQRILGLRGKHLHDYHSAGILHHHSISSQATIITDLTCPEHMEPALQAKTKAAVVRKMVALAEKTGFLYDPADLVEELEQRETLCTTGIEGGIALLHPRHHDPYMVEDSFVCIGKALQPIHFGSPDSKPTDLFFVICCQDDTIHLHVLSRICLLCHSTPLTARLRQAETSQEMHAAIKSSETELLAPS